jgi:hypothetical protein
MGWDLRTKDGIVIRGIPDDMKPDDPSLQRRVAGLRDQIRLSDPTANTGFVQRFGEGMGKAFSDIIDGGKQLFGGGPSAEEVREARQRDAPLMKTGGGMAGNISGNIAAFAPAAVIPGANTVAGAGAIGATVAALQPTESAGERLFNMGGGLILGGGTQAAVGPLAQKLGERAVNKTAELKALQSQNSVRDETIKLGQEAGYAVPPSAVAQPGFFGGRLESLGGKAALGQEASLRNQPVTNDLARQASGLRPEQALSVQNLRDVRQQAAAPYRDITALSPRAATELEAAQMARSESKLQWKDYRRNNRVESHKAATSADAEVKRALDAIDQEAIAAGKPELVDQLKLARQLIARNHQVQGALNRGDGNVDASVLGRALDSGAPLDGQLATIGRYQQTFPNFTREASKVPSPGVGKTELLAAALLGGTGLGVSDSPLGAAAGLAPFLAGPARSALLSKTVQKHLAEPNYSAGLLTRKTAELADPETRRRAAILARALVLPAIPRAVNE